VPREAGAVRIEVDLASDGEDVVTRVFETGEEALAWPERSETIAKQPAGSWSLSMLLQLRILGVRDRHVIPFRIGLQHLRAWRVGNREPSPAVHWIRRSSLDVPTKLQFWPVVTA